MSKEQQLSTLPKDKQDAIVEQWRARAEAVGLNPKAKAYRTAEVEFFVGAIAATQAMGFTPPPFWVVAIMAGRPVA